MGKKIFIIGGRCSGKTNIAMIQNSDHIVVNSKGFIMLSEPHKDTTIKHKKRIKHKKSKKNK